MKMQAFAIVFGGQIFQAAGLQLDIYWNKEDAENHISFDGEKVVPVEITIKEEGEVG